MEGLYSKVILSKQKNEIAYPSLLYIVIFFNILITVMNTSMFNIALPSIIKDINIDASMASLLVSAYSAMFAISALIYTKLSDIIPVKLLIVIGLSFLGIGSIIGFVSNNYSTLVFARILQAIGATSVSSLNVVITSKYIPYDIRGRKLAVSAMAVTLGMGLGPLIGGVVAKYLGWDYVFLISSLGVIGIPFYYLLLPTEKTKLHRFDIKGMFLIIVIFFTLILSISQNVLYFLITIVFGVLSFFHMSKNESTFLDKNVIQDKSFRSIAVIGFLIYFCNFSFVFVFPLIMSSIYKIDDEMLIGFTLLPGAIFATMYSFKVGKLVDRFKPKKITLLGIILMTCAGLFGIALVPLSQWSIVIVFSLSSSGFVCITTSLPKIIMEKVSDSYLRSSFGTLQLIQYLGGAVGVAAVGLLIDTFSFQSLEMNYIVLPMSLLVFASALSMVVYFCSLNKL